jgi:hypothetical protein
MPNRFSQIITNAKKAYKALKPHGIISHYYKVVYFPIPKVASSTVKRILHQPDNYQDPSMEIQQIEFPLIRLSEIEKYSSYKKFAIVRNPYDRMLSCYKDKIIRWYGWKKQIHPGFVRYNQIFGFKMFKPEMDFEEFMKVINKIPDSLSDEHFRSQTRFLPLKRGQLFLDFLIQIEDINQLSLVFPKITLDNLTASNSTKEVKQEILLTDQSKKLIYKRYQKDFELCNYKPLP